MNVLMRKTKKPGTPRIRLTGSSGLALFLCASLAAFMVLKVETDRILRARVPGSSIIYLPSGKYLKYATFGYSGLAADLIYIWAIQYYSNTDITDRFRYLDHIFSVIAELDPLYADPYEVGSLIASQEAHDDLEALRILDRGFEKNPNMWIFPFEAGHLARMRLRDNEKAREYFRKAMEVPGAPNLIRRLYADAAFKTEDYQTAWEAWSEILRTAADPRIRKIAENHLYQVKAAVDLRILGEAVAGYREKFGRPPADLPRLVTAGFLTALPKDYDGRDYMLDPATGGVKAPTVPWKR